MRRFLLLSIIISTAAAFCPTPVVRTQGPHIASSRSYRDRSVDDDAWTATETSTRSVSTSPQPLQGLNLPMIRNLCLSQAVLLATSVGIAGVCGATLGGLLSWRLSSVLVGVAGTSVLLALWSVVEQWAWKSAALVEFATTDLIVTLFGRRRRRETDHPASTTTLDVILLALLVSASSAVVEEVVFRGYLPMAVYALTHSPLLAVLLPALVFGLGHVHPESRPGENRLVVAWQTMQALVYTALAAATGSLWPAVLAHIFLDWHTLVAGWHAVNEQMDWAEVEHDEDQAALAEIRRQAGSALTPSTLDFLRRFFYAFDAEHRQSLSMMDVQRAIAYAYWQDAKSMDPVSVAEEFYALADGERLHLPGFLRLLVRLRQGRV